MADITREDVVLTPFHTDPDRYFLRLGPEASFRGCALVCETPEGWRIMIPTDRDMIQHRFPTLQTLVAYVREHPDG